MGGERAGGLEGAELHLPQNFGRFVSRRATCTKNTAVSKAFTTQYKVQWQIGILAFGNCKLIHIFHWRKALCGKSMLNEEIKQQAEKKKILWMKDLEDECLGTASKTKPVIWAILLWIYAHFKGIQISVLCETVFIWLYMQQMEIPGLEVESELQLPTYTKASATLGSSGCLWCMQELCGNVDP